MPSTRGADGGKRVLWRTSTVSGVCQANFFFNMQAARAPPLSSSSSSSRLAPRARARLPRRHSCAAAAAPSAQMSRYGEWPSPLTSELVIAGATGLGGVKLARAAGAGVFWLESRPDEGGRNVVMRAAGGQGGGAAEEVTPQGVNVRTRVHEYGGGAWALLGGGDAGSGDAGDEGSELLLAFVDFGSQRLFVQKLDAKSGERRGEPVALTPEVQGAALRFADFALDAGRSRLLCVAEDHRGEGKEPENLIVAVSLDGACAEPEVLVRGADFYAAPTLSPDGASLAWISWDHPQMPWTVTSLLVAPVAANGSVDATAARLVSGGEGSGEAPQQPRWSPATGRLYFVSDRQTGWWNLWRRDGEGEGEPECVLDIPAEFGGPPWGLGQHTFDFVPPAEGGGSERVLVTYARADAPGKSMALLDPDSGELEQLDTPYSTLGGVCVGAGGAVATLGGSPMAPAEVAVRDGATGKWRTVKRSSPTTVDKGYLSAPRVIEFPSKGGRTSFLYYYAPQNKDVTPVEGELPPLLVMSHGGPTSATSAAYNLRIQYFTSRGFAVADVNYGGSTGYGREYRQRLDGQWGVVDVEDCAAAADYLVAQGMVDGGRTAIDGGSAGGFTTLACLAFTDSFRAGTSFYGVASLEALAGDTHKFESRYLDSLVGPYPETQALYKERAPIENLDGISCPICLFQGLEDKIVPPNQAQMMYDALNAKNIPVALEMFEGEQHGFRKSDNIRRVLDGELDFYAQIFGFQPQGLPDGFERVKVANLEQAE